MKKIMKKIAFSIDELFEDIFRKDLVYNVHKRVKEYVVSDKLLLAKRIMILRKKNNISQKKIASLVGIKRNSISYYESGKVVPGIEYLRVLAMLSGKTKEERESIFRELAELRERCLSCKEIFAR